MPAFTSLTLNGLSGDDHVFVPLGMDAKGVSTFVNKGTSPVADEKLTISVIQSTNGGKNKTELRFLLPKVQDVTVGGVIKPTVVRSGVLTLTISTDATAPQTERDELVLLLRSAINGTHASTIVDVLTALTPYY